MRPSYSELPAPCSSLTMHSRQHFAAGDDGRFGGGEFVEPGHDGSLRREVFCQPRVRRVMPGFGLEQRAIELGQLGILHMLGQHVKPFARSGLDQPGHQQPIDGPLRLLLPHEVIQLAAIRGRRQPPKADAAFGQQVEHHVKMFQFLVDDFRHRAAQLDVFDIREDEIERRAGRLLLAVRMIDENRRQVAIDLCEPAGRGIALEVEHG